MFESNDLDYVCCLQAVKFTTLQLIRIPEFLIHRIRSDYRPTRVFCHVTSAHTLTKKRALHTFTVSPLHVKVLHNQSKIHPTCQKHLSTTVRANLPDKQSATNHFRTDSILEVAPTATQDQIRTAYKKAALKSHPDRVPIDSPERPARTKKFQRINDAYYTLSDPTRRRDYDATRQFHTGSSNTFSSDFGDEDTEQPQQQKPAGTGFPWSFFGTGANSNAKTENSQHSKFSNEQFGSVFEEMMRDADLADEEEGQTRPNGRFWTIVGAASGFGLGVIIGNITGGIAGAAAGAKLGGIRDKKGKSVYSVYQELPQGDKARLLTELASKLFSSALAG